jgi:lipoyl(octanoyl) transferase
MPPAVAPGRLRPPASFRPDPLTADQGRGAPRLQGRPGCPESVSCYPATVAIETLAHARPGSTPDPGPIAATWLGRVPYREALALQKRLAAERADGLIGDRLLLLEHPAVLTLGRTSDPTHILADDATLAARGIEVVRVERGGEVTYHGPGQLVAYPIVGLAARGLMIRPFVRSLEAALVATCAILGVAASRRDGHPGCWCEPEGPSPRKIGALGLRVERGVTYHGIALNITVDLSDFGLIDPCGMPGLISTSIAREQGDRAVGTVPTSASVEVAGRHFASAFASELGAPLDWG